MAKITNERTQAFRKAFEQNSKQIALQRGVVKNGIRASAENIQTHVENTPVFSIDLATGKVANQKQIWTLLDVCGIKYVSAQTVDDLSAEGL